MPFTFFLCKLVAAGLFVACLSFPSAAIAEQQDELAPGFNACIKRLEAGSAGEDTFEYRQARLKCYEDAADYWQIIFETEYKKETRNGDYYSGDFDEEFDVGPGPQTYLLQQFRLAWEQYFWTACSLVYPIDAPQMSCTWQSFRANEYKKMVQMLREYGIFKQPEKTAPDGQTKSFSN